ncbi:hypothetical protein JTB14_023075 [Gonioctena quinquepunctata]|nr:hypothetical protein JTB14_023075 [Gonioctena quinquepunctata]
MYELLNNSDDEDLAILEEQDDGWEYTSGNESENDERLTPVVAGEIDVQGEDDSDIENNMNEENVIPRKRKKRSDMMAQKFIWKETDLKPSLHTFDMAKSGCLLENLPEKPNVLEVFECFVTYEFVQEIVLHSHMYLNTL